MRPNKFLLLLAAALVAVACRVGPDPASEPADGRLETLGRAFGLLADHPETAVPLLASAGPGATLERARFEAWIEGLRAANSSAELWRELVEAAPPRDLAAEALTGWGAVLAEEGRSEEAVDVLERAAAEGSLPALEHLLDCSDPEARRRAGLRLALLDPGRLRRADQDLETEILASLSPEQWLERAESWHRRGSPRRAATELGRLRWRGDLERARRLALARALSDSGSSSRALALLPEGSRASPAEAVARAQACRQMAWGTYPRRGSRTWFDRSRAAAQQALADPDTGTDVRRQALSLILEVCTELNRLDQAWEAWQELARTGWRDRRRSWLGRRLGVAVATAGGSADRVLSLAGQLPDDERCLRYWAAPSGQGREDALKALASPPVADLYARWARAELGVGPPPPGTLSPATGRHSPPPTVGRLLDWGATDHARREWRRLRDLRGTSPGEALAAATLEAGAGRTHGTIRWLLSGAPQLNTVRLLDAPIDLAQAYLPLRWTAELKLAAREAGLDPWLLAGVARQESVFTAHARSPRGATGVVQLMPGTARLHARALGLGSRPDLTDPGVNLRLGARELAWLLSRYDALEPALAAYNAGDARTRRWWQLRPNTQTFTEAIPIPETYSYVRRVVFLSEAYRLVYSDTWKEEP